MKGKEVVFGSPEGLVILCSLTKNITILYVTVLLFIYQRLVGTCSVSAFSLRIPLVSLIRNHQLLGTF